MMEYESDYPVGLTIGIRSRPRLPRQSDAGSDISQGYTQGGMLGG
jgi:hypothetical protein